MYNPIDSCYKKAIQDYGVIVTIGENQTKVLIREVSDTYGIDYKKIISSASVTQGDYVYINGVQFLIVDAEEQYSQSTYNVGVFRKTQEILLGSNYKPVQSIVDRDKITLVDGTYLQEVHDQYTFIIPKLGNKTGVGNTLVYDLGIYNIISIDSSRDGLYYITGKYSSVYVPHTYTISLSESTKTLVKGETYQIVATACDNNTVVSNPTIIYTSSNPNIVAVDSTGVVTGTLVGSATITCTYNNVRADLAITVEAKPVEPVVSYTTNWSQSITQLRTYMTTTLTTNKLVDGVADSTLYISYSFDSNAQSLINQGKIVVTRKSNSSISIKNASISTTTNIYLTVTDNANSTKILDAQQITLMGM
jgi:hypothetical protein